MIGLSLWTLHFALCVAGVISGTPSVVSSVPVKYTVRGSNSGGSTTVDVWITVNDIAPSISYDTNLVYTRGSTILPLVPLNTGGQGEACMRCCLAVIGYLLARGMFTLPVF